MRTKCFVWKYFEEKCSWKIVCFVCEQAINSCIPTQKVLDVLFLLLYMFLSYHWFGKKPHRWMWRDERRTFLYSHRKQPMEHFSNIVWGTRSFTEGNIKGHRGTKIFYRGSFAKTPMFEGHDYISDRQQGGIILRVLVCKCVWFICVLSWLGLSFYWFYVFPYTP